MALNDFFAKIGALPQGTAAAIDHWDQFQPNPALACWEVSALSNSILPHFSSCCHFKYPGLIGSAAAAAQSTVGNVPARGVFATLQSASMGQ